MIENFLFALYFYVVAFFVFWGIHYASKDETDRLAMIIGIAALMAAGYMIYVGPVPFVQMEMGVGNG